MSARRWVQLAFVVAVLWFALWLLAGQWFEVRALGATLRPDWLRIAGSAALVLTSYGVLVATWRAVLGCWGATLPPFTAVRIWFVSNLGRYVPGKVWQVGAMGVMAERAGVSAVAAAGSSIVIAVVNLLVGFIVVAATGSALLEAALPRAGIVPLMVLLATLVAGLAILPRLLPTAIDWAQRVAGRVVLRPHDAALAPRAIWIAAAGCAVAWLLYGFAFRELAVGVLGAASGDAPSYVAVFTLSYLLGFLAIFAPGGIGVREVSMGTLLVAAGLAAGPEAALLVITSRLWLTALEVVPGVALLAWPDARRAADRHP